jgi:hypothetical protein
MNRKFLLLIDSTAPAGIGLLTTLADVATVKILEAGDTTSVYSVTGEQLAITGLLDLYPEPVMKCELVG